MLGGYIAIPPPLLNVDLRDNVCRRLTSVKVEGEFFKLWMTSIRPIGALSLLIGSILFIIGFSGGVETNSTWAGITALLLDWVPPMYLVMLNFSIIKQITQTFEFWFLSYNNAVFFLAMGRLYHWDARVAPLFGVVFYIEVAFCFDALPKPIMFTTVGKKIAFLIGFLGGTVLCFILSLSLQFHWVPSIQYNESVTFYQWQWTFDNLATQAANTLFIFMMKNLVLNIAKPDILALVNASVKWQPTSGTDLPKVAVDKPRLSFQGVPVYTPTVVSTSVLTLRVPAPETAAHFASPVAETPISIQQLAADGHDLIVR